jgi:hypothetical protein
MSQEKPGSRRSARSEVRIHLGASGLLQPLSEEFLYRSPTRQAGLARRFRNAAARGPDDVAV